jgi:hypothetical protein
MGFKVSAGIYMTRTPELGPGTTFTPAGPGQRTVLAAAVISSSGACDSDYGNNSD